MRSEDDIPYQTDFVDSGWMRWLPGLSWRLNMMVSCLQLDRASGSPWEQRPSSRAGRVAQSFGGRHAPAWASEIESIGQCETDEERADERAAKARLEQLLATAGLPAIASADDLLDLMLRLGLFSRSVDQHSNEWWEVVEPLPLPEEKLSLSALEIEREDRIRWQTLTLDAQGKLIDHLLTDETSEETVTSLHRLSESLVLDPETVHQALLVICSGASFTTSHDLELLEEHQDLTITLNRNAFVREHVGIQMTESESESGE